ncbi:MAG: lactate dehydrogenase [Belnapia sp.]|nr:lactate dehydrogenase [Belnapia sp.]
MAECVAAEDLRRFMAGIYQAVGVPPADAAQVAGLMAEADLIGADGHGVFRLAQYVRRMRAGGMNPCATPRIIEERPASALIDGDNGLGHLATTLAARTAIAKARTQGVAWCGVRNGNHAGPASLYARMVQEAGMIGLYLAVGSANHLPPWGGLELLLSTNPIAVAIPARHEPPIVLDMATTVAAYGKVKVKAQRGEAMPVGWMIDRLGQALTDPKRANEGLLLPIGGYKGYGLALVFGLLAGTLNGAAMGREVVDFNADDTTVTNTGQAILAIDIAAFGDPEAFRDRIDALAREIRGSERLPGVERIFLPGEQSAATRARRVVEGVPIPPALRAQLDTLAAELGAARL